MSISTYLEPIAKAEELVKKLLIDEFQTSDTNAQMLYDDYVKQHIEKLKDTTYLFAESSYVDKVFRNSYYHYYSSKRAYYRRDCIRISVFKEKFWKRILVRKVKGQNYKINIEVFL